MKRYALVLLLSLLIPIVSFSQHTYPKIVNDSLVLITTTQLKESNLIFIDHDNLLKTNNLLKRQVNVLNEINMNWASTDSIKTINYNKYVNTLKKNYKAYKIKRTLGESLVGILIIAGIILW